jgi:hypothetical protein
VASIWLNRTRRSGPDDRLEGIACDSIHAAIVVAICAFDLHRKEKFEMTLRKIIGLFAGVSVLLILATPPTARAYVQSGHILSWQGADKNTGAKPVTTNPMWEKSQLQSPGRPWRGGPDNPPLGEEPSAPIPEPGTLTLLSLGLLALGAAMRKFRGANAPSVSTSR